MTNPKGTAFETMVVDYLRNVFGTRQIDRRPRKGAKDEGDVAGLSCRLGPVVVEVKNVKRLNLAGWIEEAQVERGNADAALGVVVHKRVGKGRGQMGDQYVTLRLEDFARLLGGEP